MAWTVKNAKTKNGQFAVHVNSNGDVQFPFSSGIVEGDTFSIGSISYNVLSAKDLNGRGEVIITSVVKEDKKSNGTKTKKERNVKLSEPVAGGETDNTEQDGVSEPIND